MAEACCTFAALHWNSSRTFGIAVFSPLITSHSPISPFPIPWRSYVYFFIVVWCTNTSPLVIFLWMKSYLFLNSELKAFLVMILDMLACGAVQVTVPCTVVTSGAALGACSAEGWSHCELGAVSGCWVLSWLLMVAVVVMVSAATCSHDDNQGCIQFSEVLCPLLPFPIKLLIIFKAPAPRT